MTTLLFQYAMPNGYQIGSMLISAQARQYRADAVCPAVSLYSLW